MYTRTYSVSLKMCLSTYSGEYVGLTEKSNRRMEKITLRSFIIYSSHNIGRYHLGDLGINGMIILKCMSNIQDCEIWGFNASEDSSWGLVGYNAM
jgi:hypothetical protein